MNGAITLETALSSALTGRRRERPPNRRRQSGKRAESGLRSELKKGHRTGWALNTDTDGVREGEFEPYEMYWNDRQRAVHEDGIEQVIGSREITEAGDTQSKEIETVKISSPPKAPIQNEGNEPEVKTEQQILQLPCTATLRKKARFSLPEAAFRRQSAKPIRLDVVDEVMEQRSEREETLSKDKSQGEVTEDSSDVEEEDVNKVPEDAVSEFVDRTENARKTPLRRQSVTSGSLIEMALARGRSEVEESKSQADESLSCEESEGEGEDEKEEGKESNDDREKLDWVKRFTLGADDLIDYAVGAMSEERSRFSKVASNDEDESVEVMDVTCDEDGVADSVAEMKSVAVQVEPSSLVVSVGTVTKSREVTESGYQSRDEDHEEETIFCDDNRREFVEESSSPNVEEKDQEDDFGRAEPTFEEMVDDVPKFSEISTIVVARSPTAVDSKLSPPSMDGRNEQESPRTLVTSERRGNTLQQPKRPAKRELRHLPRLEEWEGEANGGDIRRSERVRFKPLKFWKNETVVYGRNEDWAMPAVVGLLKNEGGPPMAEQPPKTKGRVQRKRKPRTELEVANPVQEIKKKRGNRKQKVKATKPVKALQKSEMTELEKENSDRATEERRETRKQVTKHLAIPQAEVIKTSLPPLATTEAENGDQLIVSDEEESSSVQPLREIKKNRAKPAKKPASKARSKAIGRRKRKIPVKSQAAVSPTAEAERLWEKESKFMAVEKVNIHVQSTEEGNQQTPKKNRASAALPLPAPKRRKLGAVPESVRKEIDRLRFGGIAAL